MKRMCSHRHVALPDCHPALDAGSKAEILNQVQDDNNPGVSLIISIIFVSAFMLVIADLTEVQINVIRSMGNREASAKAFYLAESAQELANYVAQTSGVGANAGAVASETAGDVMGIALNEVAMEMGLKDETTGASLCMPASGSSDPPCAGFEIVGRADTTITFNGDQYYSVPLAYMEGTVIKGTGSAAKECVDSANPDDPCHWNKIGLGEAVEIPLYYEEDADGDGTIEDEERIKPSFSAGDSFVLRVRAPCAGYQTGKTDCTADERIVLYPPVVNPSDPNAQNYPFRNVDKDPVLIQWMIVDEGGDDTLIAADKKETDSRYKNMRVDPSVSDNITKNTELSAGRINDAANHGGDLPMILSDFEVLQANYKGKDLTDTGNPEKMIVNFVKNEQHPPERTAIEKPVLRLTLVERPKRNDCRTDPVNRYNEFINDTSCDIPYLEYQLLTKQEDPAYPEKGVVSDAKSALTGYAIVGDFRKEFKAYRNRAPSLGGFAMESF